MGVEPVVATVRRLIQTMVVDILPDVFVLRSFILLDTVLNQIIQAHRERRRSSDTPMSHFFVQLDTLLPILG